MNLRNKILRAINKGLNEALNLDDFSEDDLKILKKSLGTIIKDSNYRNSKGYYQELINLIMFNYPFISKDDIDLCIVLHNLIGVLYNPLLDGKEFMNFINKILYTCGVDIDLNWIDTTEVTDMHSLFDESRFTGNISEWNVSNVTNMKNMFHNSRFNGDISKWNVSKVINMYAMFGYLSKFNGDISKWNVSHVEDMSFMFYHSDFNKDISKWNVSKVKSMYSMFQESNFDQDISNWNINHDCNRKYIFYKCPIKEEYKPTI